MDPPVRSLPLFATDCPRPAHRSSHHTIGGLLVLVGIWGGLVPFVGPSFGFSMGSTPAWTWTESAGTLHVAPAIVAVIAGAALIVGVARPISALAAAVAGVWFVIGPSLHPLWASASAPAGHAMTGGTMVGMGGSDASSTRQALEAIGYHYGTGALIAVLGSLALGLALATRSATAADVERSPSPRATRLSGHPAGA